MSHIVYFERRSSLLMQRCPCPISASLSWGTTESRLHHHLCWTEVNTLQWCHMACRHFLFAHYCSQNNVKYRLEHYNARRYRWRLTFLASVQQKSTSIHYPSTLFVIICKPYIKILLSTKLIVTESCSFTSSPPPRVYPSQDHLCSSLEPTLCEWRQWS